MDDYIRGQWLSLNRILDYLNTLDEQVVNKKKLYHDIFDLRPLPKENAETRKKNNDLSGH
ncbi:MAG: hypothetical protein P4L79_10710 [Legionella sp.]|uniref:hypothetical protein n=1 Tax=Legionella sp. TaxID=459 RepID=UPI00284B9CD0|nr:hypothetical protein [Legionella sp.]